MAENIDCLSSLTEHIRLAIFQVFSQILGIIFENPIHMTKISFPFFSKDSIKFTGRNGTHL